MLRKVMVLVFCLGSILPYAVSKADSKAISRAQESPYRIRVGGFTYAYSTKHQGQRQYGVAQVIEDATASVVYEERLYPPGGCGDAMPPISSYRTKNGKNDPGIGSDIVIFCSSSLQHDTVSTLFLGGHLLDRLEFGRYSPNVEVTGDGLALRANVIEEIPLSGGLGRFLVVYGLSMEFGVAYRQFKPWFGKGAEESYRAYYLSEISKANAELARGISLKSTSLEPALAALAATGNTEFICGELDKEPWRTLAPDRIAQLNKANQGYGFPDLNVCR